MRVTTLSLCLIFVLVVTGVNFAQSTPQQIKVQGFLNDKSGGGEPVPATGAYDLTFILYDSDVDGIRIGDPVTFSQYPIVEGFYEVTLAFSASDFSGPTTERYLEIMVGTEVLFPRLRVASVPYAYTAEKLGDLDSADIAAADQALQEQITTLNTEVVTHLDGGIDPHPQYVRNTGDYMTGDLTMTGGSLIKVRESSRDWFRMSALSNALVFDATEFGNHSDLELMRLSAAGGMRVERTTGIPDGEFLVSLTNLTPGGMAGGVLRLQGGSRSPNSKIIEALDFDGETMFEVDGLYGTSTRVLTITGGADLSEEFDVREDESITPGMLVSIDPDGSGSLSISTDRYDRRVAGIISGAGGIRTGMVMGQEGSIADGEHPVALTGRVYALATASNGAIKPGDLLTTSTLPGHAMKVTDKRRGSGATIGKAMSSLREGEGLILVLVNLQ